MGTSSSEPKNMPFNSDEKIKIIEQTLERMQVCICCGCIYHESFIRNQQCPACGEGVS
jgi:rRNA maturation endonuclease Nob1